MSGFRDMLASDIGDVFLNTDEFAEKYTIVYDGARYEEVPAVFTGMHEDERPQLQDDHAQGLYRAARVINFALSALDGVQPEQGTRISIGSGGDAYMQEFYIASSDTEYGMVRAELEAIEE